MDRVRGGGAIGGSVDVISERERRLLRLKQVREQSKEIAKKLRVKFNEEKNKQSTSVSKQKPKQFEKFRDDSTQFLKNKYECRTRNLESTKPALTMEENLKREWLTQKQYNVSKVREKSETAFDSMHIKRTREKEMNKLGCKRWDSPRKSRSPTISSGNTNTTKKSSTEKINQFYEESDGAENCCSNFQHHLKISSNDRLPLSVRSASNGDSNPSFNKKRVTISEDLKNDGISSLPMKDDERNEIYRKYSEIENIHKSSKSEPHIKSQEQLSITDIQKALCDCQPHFKNVATNVEHLFNNNYKDNHVKKPTGSIKKISSWPNTDHKNKTAESNCENSDINENAKFTPLTIISDYLKTRDVCFDNIFTNNVDKKDPEESNVEHLEKVKDLIEHCRYLHSSGFIGDKKYSDRKELVSKECVSSKTPDILKQNAKRKPTFNVKRTPIRNIRLSKSNPSKLKLRSNVSNWEYIPYHGQRSIDSCDQGINFSNELFINDKYSVDRLPSEIRSAYQDAAIHSARRIQHAKELEKIEVKDDYKNLIEELNALNKEKKHIGKTLPDKISKSTSRNHNKINHQKFINKSVKHMLQTDDHINNSEKIHMKSKSHGNSNIIISDQNETSVNVATWDVSNNFNLKNRSDSSLKGSESSIQSIIFQKHENTNPNHVDKISKIESTEKIVTNNENKIVSDIPTKMYEYLNSTDEEQTRNKIRKKSLKKVKLSSTNKDTLMKNDNEVDNASTTTNTVSFEGLQIVIEVRKAKKETSKVKTCKTKNEEVQTVEKFDSSSEVSIKTSEIVSKQKVIFEKVNSQQRYDSSESTTYMSPPDKFTTHFEKMFKKDAPIFKVRQMSTSNVSHTSDIVMKNIAVNTDFNLNDNQIAPQCELRSGITNILQEISNFHKPTESLTSVNKSIQVDLIKTSKDLQAKVIDTRLKSYIEKLLGMSESEIKQLNIDVSDIYTPNSSIINMPSNKPAPTQDVYDKVERLKKFIKENYALLEDFKKEETILNSEKIKYIVKKPIQHASESVIHSGNNKIVNKLDLKSKSQPNLLTKNTISSVEESDINKTDKTKSNPKNQKHPFQKQFIPNEIIETSSQENIETNSSTENKIDINIIRRVIPVEHESNRNVNLKLSLSDKDEKSHQNSQSCLDDDDMFVILHRDKSDDSTENKVKFIEPQEDLVKDEFCKDNIELDQLSDECTRKILDLSQKLNQVRKEKQALLSSNTSNSSEGSSVPQNYKTTLTDVAFVPMLDGIPKPNNDEDRMTQINSLRDKLHSHSQSKDTFLPKLLEFNSNDFQEAKTSLVINNQSMANKNLLVSTPHELSTIIEVDTPATIKNSSLNYPNVSAKLGNIVDLSNNRVGREKTQDEQMTPPKLSVSKFMDGVQVEANLNSFISFTDFIHQRQNEESSSSDDSLRSLAVKLLKKNFMSEKLKSGYSSSNSSLDNSSIMEAIVSNNTLFLEKTKSSLNPKYDISGVLPLQTSSHSLTPELEKLGKSFEPNKGLTTLKKTQEAQILSSSNSSLQMLFDKLDNETMGKTADGTDNTGTLHDDLNLSDEFRMKTNLMENISDMSLYKKLDDLLKNIGKKCKEKESGGNFASDASLKDQIVKSTTSVVDSINVQSRDKTQHRTSTPVHLKSSNSSNTRNSSNNGSSGIFNVDSDLSSVKNVSNSDKTLSDDRLSVPNVTLKFGKLFDSSTLDNNTQ